MTAFVYIARKGEYWGGIMSSDMPPKMLAKEIASYVRDGFEIVGVHDRETYFSMLESMKPWNQSPDFVAKKSMRRK